MRAFREANSFSGKSFYASSESKVLALNALSVGFADIMRSVRQTLFIAGVTVSVIAFYAERFQQFLEFPENIILSSAECKSYDFTAVI